MHCFIQAIAEDSTGPAPPMSLAPPPKARVSLNLHETAKFLREADDILIVSHLRPDGDCIGSTLGLLQGLEKLGKRVAAYNAHEIGPKFAYLPGIERIENKMPAWPVRFTVFVDCGAVRRVSQDFVPIGTTLNIDHHLTNDVFGDYNFILPEAAAVGDQVAQLLKVLGVEIDSSMAQALYLSLMGDTGGFRYSNTTASAFELAADLVRRGADPGKTAMYYYEMRHAAELVLTGRALSRLKLEEGDMFAWSELRQADYREAAGEEDVEPEGLVNELRTIDTVEVSLLLHETPEGFCRAGFRGKGIVDCAAIAQSCGGGGHFNASGAVLDKLSFDEGKQRALEATRAAVRKYRAFLAQGNPPPPRI